MNHEANNRLAGRTALVTGAGSPAGRAICERFALAALPQMPSRGTGMIVNVGWYWGDSRDPAEGLARATSEAAVARRESDPVLEGVANGTTVRVGADATPQRVAGWVTVLAALQGRPPASRPAAALRRE